MCRTAASHQGAVSQKTQQTFYGTTPDFILHFCSGECAPCWRSQGLADGLGVGADHLAVHDLLHNGDDLLRGGGGGVGGGGDAAGTGSRNTCIKKICHAQNMKFW